MEIELKYDLTAHPEAADKIFDNVMMHFLEDGEVEEIPMVAIYYDTADLALAKKKIAFRVRKEGERMVGTLKWNAETEAALSMREEMNLQLPKELAAEPTIAMFEESDIYEQLEEACGDRKLEPIVTMRFTRMQVRVDTGKSISELSVDKGEIRTPNGTEPILEMELEYFSGDIEDMKGFGARIAEKYHLAPEPRSKFARGFALLQGETLAE